MPSKKEKAFAEVRDEQIMPETYQPSTLESEHLTQIYKRYGEMYKNMESLGIFDEISRAESLYINSNKSYKDGEVPPVNIPIEIEIAETRTAEEVKVQPEVVLVPLNERDRVKVEALQETIEYIENKNQNELKQIEFLLNKNIYGFSYQKIYWKETRRDVKVITDTKETEEGKLPKLIWKKVNVKSYSDVSIKNIDPKNLLISENATSLRDANEVIEIWVGDYDSAKEEYGHFPNFKYVVKNANNDALEIPQEYRDRITGFGKGIEAIVLNYWNKTKDEHSISCNGVLLTQYSEDGGNPSMYSKFKGEDEFFPYVRGVARYVPGTRTLYPKGDVILVERLKQLKNVLYNAIVESVLTNSKAVLTVPKEIAQHLKKLGSFWQHMNILPVQSKESAQAVRPIQIQVDVSGGINMMNKIDETITTVTGVDTRSLLSSVRETATKTAVRQETSLKRIAMGIKLFENEALYRKTKIMLALIKEYYETEEEYLDDNELENGIEKKVKRSKTIPVKNKKYKWVTKQEPIPKEEIKKLVDMGLEEKQVGLIFDTDDGEMFEFTPDMDELKSRFKFINKQVMKAIMDLYEDSSFTDLVKSDAPGENGELEIRDELLETAYEVEIRSRGTSSYSEAFEREKMTELMYIVAQNPIVDQVKLFRKLFEVNGLPADMISEQPPAPPPGAPPAGPPPGAGGMPPGMPPEMAAMMGGGGEMPPPEGGEMPPPPA